MNGLELLYVETILEKCNNYTSNMSYIGFGSFLCMLSEEWCKQHDENVVEFTQTIAQMVTEVNNELGEY